MAKRTAKKTSKWIQLVKETYRKNKKIRGGYTLKNAIQDAKKVYESSANRISSMMSKKTKKNKTIRGGQRRDDGDAEITTATNQ